MRKLLILSLLVLLIFLVGCTQEDLEDWQGITKSCQDFQGYLCSAPDECAVSYLDVIESYCCPIPCKTCNQSCEDLNICTKDYCSKDTNYECKYESITPCANNGICEEGEYKGAITFCPGNPLGRASSVSASDVKSVDCPQNCNDNNPNTADSYDFEKQECKHEVCQVEEEIIEEQETEEISGLEPPYVVSVEDNLGNQCDVIANTGCFNGNRPKINVGDRLTFTINAKDPTDDKIYYNCYSSANQGYMGWQTENTCIWDVTIADYINFPVFFIFIKDDNNHYFHGGVEADQEVHLYYEVVP